MSRLDPVPTSARVELERLARRWQQLPLDRALAHAPALRELAQEFADEAADACASPRAPLADLGPAAAYDQLVVTTYDLAVATDRTPSRGGGDPGGAEVPDVAARLAFLRRTL